MTGDSTDFDHAFSDLVDRLGFDAGYRESVIARAGMDGKRTIGLTREAVLIMKADAREVVRAAGDYWGDWDR